MKRAQSFALTQFRTNAVQYAYLIGQSGEPYFTQIHPFVLFGT